MITLERRRSERGRSSEVRESVLVLFGRLPLCWTLRASYSRVIEVLEAQIWKEKTENVSFITNNRFWPKKKKQSFLVRFFHYSRQAHRRLWDFPALDMGLSYLSRSRLIAKITNLRADVFLRVNEEQAQKYRWACLGMQNQPSAFNSDKKWNTKRRVGCERGFVSPAFYWLVISSTIERQTNERKEKKIDKAAFKITWNFMKKKKVRNGIFFRSFSRGLSGGWIEGDVRWVCHTLRHKHIFSLKEIIVTVTSLLKILVTLYLGWSY